MNSTKQRLSDNLVIGIIIGVLSFCAIQYILIHVFRVSETKTPELNSKHIKTEYFLEVSEDSIKIESQQGRVYTGKYSELDSLITADNL